MSRGAYCCDLCGYETDKKFLMDQHLRTLKHKTNAGRFICECGRSYKHRQSYTRHKRKCSVSESMDVKSITDQLATVVADIKKENKSLHTMFKSLSKNASGCTTIHNSFNVNVFLNSHCKDAIDIGDFVDSIEFDGNKGRVLEGSSTATVTKALINELDSLSIGKRPIHCTDAKREVLYVKDQGVWEKDPLKEKLKGALDIVSLKHASALRDCLKDCDQAEYCSIIQSMTSPVSKDQVIKGLIRNVLIDKAHKVTET